MYQVKKITNLFTLFAMVLSMQVFADAKSENIPAIKNLKKVDQTHYSSGQPSREEISQLAELGFKHIINLRAPGEMKWDEAGHVKSLGMNYYSIPVAGVSGFNKENAQALADAYKKIGDEKVLVHCGSGNRVGGLNAFLAGMSGKSIEDSLKEGRAWGMTHIEPAVRAKLSEHKNN